MRERFRGVRSLAKCGVIILACVSWACGAEESTKDGYEVHDPKRPQPVVVTPGTNSTQDASGQPPSDAIVLFDGKDLSKWRADKTEKQEKAGEPDKPAAWTVAEGHLAVAAGKGNIRTNDEFRDVQLHAEFWHPTDIAGNSQGRGNSGIFFMGTYELQVLDSHNSETYADGMVGSMYGQYPPLVNASRTPGQWQTYDVIFRAPQYDGERVAKPARMTVLLNGVVVQDNVDLLGPTKHSTLTEYPKTHPEKGPIKLQDHGHPVRFRNIWLRELGANPPAAARSAKAAKKPATVGAK